MNYQKTVNVERLTKEISDSAISIALNYINSSGSNCDVVFKTDLSTNEILILTSIIESHLAIPFPVIVKDLIIGSIPPLSPFSAKIFGNKKLYKRIHGIQKDLIVGNNETLFTVPYSWVKINGIEVVGGENLDTINLHILDSISGTFSTIPNYQLNQFGFTVNICKDFYQNLSEFDADLYGGMQIKLVYNSISVKRIGFNFLLSELK